jgi:hypothetical protein
LNGADVLQRLGWCCVTLSDGVALADGAILPDCARLADCLTLAACVTLPDGVTLAGSLTLPDGARLADCLSLAACVTLPDGVTLAGSLTLPDGVALVDGVTLPDGVPLPDYVTLLDCVASSDAVANPVGVVQALHGGQYLPDALRLTGREGGGGRGWPLSEECNLWRHGWAFSPGLAAKRFSKGAERRQGPCLLSPFFSVQNILGGELPRALCAGQEGADGPLFLWFSRRSEAGRNPPHLPWTAVRRLRGAMGACITARKVATGQESAMRRVVVTGLGMVTPLACGVEETWSRLLAGQSGAGPITRFDASQVVTQYACEIPMGDGSDGTFNPDDWMEPKDRRKVDDFILYGMAAAVQAVRDAGWEPEDEESRCGPG